MTMVPIEQYLVQALAGLDVDRNDPDGHIGKSAAYRLLKEGSGQVFGHDVARWQAWVDANPHTFAMPDHPIVEKWLANLAGALAAFGLYDDPNYLTEEQALEKLKEYTGHNFGYDEDKWREWFAINKPEDLVMFPPGYD